LSGPSHWCRVSRWTN